MTDFHESLDRALDDEHPYAWTPPADRSFIGYIDEAMEFRNQDLLDLQDRINGAIIRQDDRSVTFRLNSMVERKYRWAVEYDATLDDDEPVGYDGFGAPLYAHQLDPKGTE